MPTVRPEGITKRQEPKWAWKRISSAQSHWQIKQTFNNGPKQ